MLSVLIIFGDLDRLVMTNSTDRDHTAHKGHIIRCLQFFFTILLQLSHTFKSDNSQFLVSRNLVQAHMP